MTQTNDRIALERSHLQQLDPKTLDQMAEAILTALGQPLSTIQAEALASFNDRQWDEVKRFCLCDPCDSYLAALSCLASAYRSATIADSVLRDAARHTADFARVRTAHHLAARFTAILG
jgi:hypothetical protein